MARDTFERFFPVVVAKAGPSYLDARNAFLSLPPGDWAEIRPRIEAAALPAEDWQTRLGAAILLGWTEHREDYIQCAIFARGDFTSAQPAGGFTPLRRAEAIVQLGPDVTPRVLELLLKTDECRDPKAVAALFLAVSLLKDPRAAEPMISLLSTHPSGDLARGAVQALSALGEPRGLPPTLAIAGDWQADPELRSAAIEALGGYPGPEAAETLLALAGAEEAPIEIRETAAGALSKLAYPPAAAGILALLRRDREEEDEELRAALFLALGEAATEAEIPAIHRLGEDGSPGTKQNVQRTVDRIRWRREESQIRERRAPTPPAQQP